MRAVTARALAVWLAGLGLPLVVLAVPLALEAARSGIPALAALAPSLGTTLGNTLVLGVLTSLAVTGLAWALAHLRRFHSVRGGGVLHALTLAPIVMPSFTFAMALVVLAGHDGLLTARLGPGAVDVYGMPGLVAAGTLAHLPFAYLAMLAAYDRVDPAAFDAARDLGASPWRAHLRVGMPRLRRPVVAVALMAFADAVADLANPLVIGGEVDVLASRLHEAVRGEGDLATASGLALVLLVPPLVHLFLASRLGDARPGPWAARIDAGAPRASVRSAPRALLALGWGTAGCVALLLGVVVLAAFQRDGGTIGVVAVADGPHAHAVAASVFVTLLAVPLVTGLGLVLALAVFPRPELLAGARRLAASAAGVPSIVLGLAALLLVLRVQEAWGGGAGSRLALVLGAVLLVHVVRSLPTAARTLTAALEPLTPGVRAAAIDLGATRADMVRDVVLPRVRGPLRRVGLTTAARTLTATSSVLFLADERLPLLTPHILTMIDAGHLPLAAALTLAIAALLGVFAALTRPRATGAVR